MRSLSRAAVVSALALPLAFGGAGIAAASGGGDYNGKCVDHSCWIKSWWSWKGDITEYNVINAGIINA